MSVQPKGILEKETQNKFAEKRLFNLLVLRESKSSIVSSEFGSDLYPTESRESQREAASEYSWKAFASVYRRNDIFDSACHFNFAQSFTTVCATTVARKRATLQKREEKREDISDEMWGETNKRRESELSSLSSLLFTFRLKLKHALSQNRQLVLLLQTWGIPLGFSITQE